MKHPTTLALLNNLAFLYESQGDFQRSELNYEKVIELNKEVYGRAPQYHFQHQQAAYLCVTTTRKSGTQIYFGL